MSLEEVVGLDRARGRRSRIAALALGLVVAIPAIAHHSFAMYDTRITETLTGRLTRFIPGANHAQIIFELVDADGRTSVGADGEPILWGVETGPAAQIAREGVTLESFPVGTVINVTLNPLRDGRHFGALAREGGRIVHCGTEVPQTGCDEQTGTVFLSEP